MDELGTEHSGENNMTAFGTVLCLIALFYLTCSIARSDYDVPIDERERLNDL